MIKYFCDKCGKELKDYDIFTVEITPPEIQQWEDNAYTADPFILCRNCMKNFHVWIAKNENVRKVVQPAPQVVWTNYIPEACRSCRNHPANGGSGMCHCTLGSPKVTSGVIFAEGDKKPPASYSTSASTDCANV